MAEMQSLPERSLSATLKKRWLFFFKSDLKTPKVKMINTSSLTIFSDIINFIKHRDSRDTNLIKHQLSIVNSIETHLPAHIFNSDPLDGFHLCISNRHDKWIDSLILSLHESLCKHDSIVSVTGAIRDPILLREGGG